MSMTRTRQVNRLRALLLIGEEADRNLSRGTLTGARLQRGGHARGVTRRE